MRCCSYQYLKATDHSYHKCACLCSAKVHVSLVNTACLHYISDIHDPTCSKISPVHLQTPQERQNGRMWTSLGSKLEETTTLDVLHYPMGSEIGPVHLHLHQEKEDVHIYEAKRCLHPQKNQTFTSPRQKDIYIPEAKRLYIPKTKRCLHPIIKKTFTSPKQKAVYIPEAKRLYIPEKKDVYIHEKKKTFTSSKKKTFTSQK